MTQFVIVVIIWGRLAQGVGGQRPGSGVSQQLLIITNYAPEFSSSLSGLGYQIITRKWVETLVSIGPEIRVGRPGLRNHASASLVIFATQNAQGTREFWRRFGNYLGAPGQGGWRPTPWARRLPTVTNNYKIGTRILEFPERFGLQNNYKAVS